MTSELPSKRVAKYEKDIEPLVFEMLRTPASGFARSRAFIQETPFRENAPAIYPCCSLPLSLHDMGGKKSHRYLVEAGEARALRAAVDVG